MDGIIMTESGALFIMVSGVFGLTILALAAVAIYGIFKN